MREAYQCREDREVSYSKPLYVGRTGLSVGSHTVGYQVEYPRSGESGEGREE